MTVSPILTRRGVTQLLLARLLPVPLILAGRPRPAVAQTDLAIAYGWDPAHAAPTTASLYVAPNGDDSAAGGIDAPLQSLTAGVERLKTLPPGSSLALRGGIYRETVSLSGLTGTPESPYHIHRYGSERVTITAADPLSGWAEVPPAAARALGVPEAGGQLYRATLPTAALEHESPEALNLYLAGRRAAPAIDRARTPVPGVLSEVDSLYPAQYLIHNGDEIAGLQDDRLIGIDPAWLSAARVRLYTRPNVVRTMEIASFDPATGTILLATQNRRVQMSGEVPVMRYGLLNTPLGLAPGHWLARESEGAPEVEVLYHSAAGPPEAAEVSLRTHCINLGTASHVHLTGIEALRAAGPHRSAAICLRRGRGLSGGTGLKVTHCRFGETDTGPGTSYGAVNIIGATDLTMAHVSIADGHRDFGLFLNDCTDVDLRFLHITRAFRSPARFYGLRRAVLAFSLFEDSAAAAHSNKFNFYEGSDLVLVYGVRCRQVGGYVTYQESSRIHFAFCDFPCAPGSRNRALVSQNRRPGNSDQGGPDGTGEPEVGTTFYYWNLALQSADFADPGPARALRLGPGGTSQQHSVHNSLIHGGGFADIYTDGSDPSREVRSHNRYTGFSFWQTARYGWSLGLGEAAHTAARLPTGPARDMRDVIAELAPLFPTFDHWDRDIDGRRVDWDVPPLGPIQR